MTARALFIAVLIAAGAGGSASAQDSAAIASAKAASIVGERFDGYLGYVTQPSGLVRAQVDAINIRRRALYTGLAERRGVAPQEVGITAGCFTLARVRVGESYMLVDGEWRRRGSGQPPPVPNYCG